MGADHTGGNLISAYASQILDPLKTDGQVAASRDLQIGLAAVDSTGICLFAAVGLAEGEGAEAFLKAIKAKLGTRLAPADVGALGTRIIKAEREFIRKTGLAEKDDRLPRFYYEEPLPPHNKVFLITDAELGGTFGGLSGE
jgi:aldehyde:ferredoxin oxidoreductase